MDLIYTKKYLLLTRQSKDWRFWQDFFEDYMASLSFDNVNDLIYHFRLDYKFENDPTEKLENALQSLTGEILIINIDDEVLEIQEYEKKKK